MLKVRPLAAAVLVLAVFLGSVPARAEPVPSAPPPPPALNGPRWQQTCENIPSGKLDTRVKDRGLAGWELVTILGEGSGFIGCFKRPG